MIAQTVKNAVAIPATSLLTAQDGSTTVMVVGPDNRAHQTKVTPGIRDGDRVQIVEGVAAGDRVITSGAYALPDQTKVTIETAAESGDKKPDAGRDDKNDGDKKDEK
jgi:multidrug efflux pump subunit AcrA (membrane-fusion protein)